MIKIKMIVIVLAITALIYFIYHRQYFFKSIYQTLKTNPLLRMRAIRWVLKILARIFFRRF